MGTSLNSRARQLVQGEALSDPALETTRSCMGRSSVSGLPSLPRPMARTHPPRISTMRQLMSSLLLVTLLAACQTAPPTDAEGSRVNASTLTWVATYNNCDHASKLAALYDTDAVLWGTMSQAIISTPGGIQQYFERACMTNPKSTVELGQQLVRVYGDTAVSSGTYAFTVFSGGQARVVPARFSMTYRRNGDRWLIVNHHSSAMPAPPAQPSPPRQ